MVNDGKNDSLFALFFFFTCQVLEIKCEEFGDGRPIVQKPFDYRSHLKIQSNNIQFNVHG